MVSSATPTSSGVMKYNSDSAIPTAFGDVLMAAASATGADSCRISSLSGAGTPACIVAPTSITANSGAAMELTECAGCIQGLHMSSSPNFQLNGLHVMCFIVWYGDCFPAN